MPQVGHLLSEANSAQQPLRREWIGGVLDSAHSRLLYNFADVTNQFNSTAVDHPNSGVNISLQQSEIIPYSFTNQNIERYPLLGDKVMDLIVRSSLSQPGPNPVVQTAVGLTVGAVEIRTGMASIEINVTLPSQSGAIEAYPSHTVVGPNWFVWTTIGGVSGTADTNFATIYANTAGATFANAVATIFGNTATSPNAVGTTFGAISAQAADTTVATSAASLLMGHMLAERTSADIDEESIGAALAATDDALMLIQHNNLAGTPHVMYSNDGILTLQWERDQYGVALLFCGDREVSIAFRRPGQLYAENGVEQPVSEKLPLQFYKALATVLEKSEKA